MLRTTDCADPFSRSLRNKMMHSSEHASGFKPVPHPERDPFHDTRWDLIGPGWGVGLPGRSMGRAAAHDSEMGPRPPRSQVFTPYG